jgi:ribosome maturation factor RimP
MIMMHEVEELQELVTPLAKEVNAQIIQLNCKKRGGDFAIQLIVDLEFGGISIEVCSRLNKQFATLIEEKAVLPGDFTLEVSSPGLDWPLRSQADFHRKKEKDVVIYLTAPVEGKVQWEGKVDQATDEGVIIKTNKNIELLIPYALVSKGVQIV